MNWIFLRRKKGEKENKKSINETERGEKKLYRKKFMLNGVGVERPRSGVWGERGRERRRMIHKQVNLSAHVFFYTILRLNGFMNVTRTRAPFSVRRVAENATTQSAFLSQLLELHGQKICFWREVNNIVVSYPTLSGREWRKKKGFFYGKLGILIHVACSDVWILCVWMRGNSWGLSRWISEEMSFLWFELLW